MNNHTHYLKIVSWATQRYTTKNGLTVFIGGKPTRYTIIERLAAHKYLYCNIHTNH